jgi:hypothetical protein
MKLPRFRLGTLLKAVVVVNLAAGLLWLNLRWINVHAERAMILRLRIAPSDINTMVYRLTSSTPSLRLDVRIRGWLRVSQGDSRLPPGLYSKKSERWDNWGRRFQSDIAALRFNIAVCVSILLGVVLVMRVGDRLVTRLRPPAGGQGESAT